MKIIQPYSDNWDDFLTKDQAFDDWSAKNFYSRCSPQDTSQDTPQYTPQYIPKDTLQDTLQDAAEDFMTWRKNFEISLKQQNQFFSS